MTISDNYTPIKRLGDGSTTQFSPSPTWPMLDASFAQVFLQDVITGVQTPVGQGAGANQYQIVLTSTGFTVTFGTAPTSANYVIIGRSTSRTQTTPYTTSQGFQGKNEEFSFDKLTAMVQEANNTFSRAIVAPLADTAMLQLPTATARAGQFLAFDSSGNVIVASGVSAIPISAAMQPVVQAASVLAGFNLLAASGGAFTVSPTVPTPTLGDSSTKVANMAALAAAIGSLVNVQVITGSTTYTPTAGATKAIGFVQGSGGGSGGNGTSGQTSGGQGGTTSLGSVASVPGGLGGGSASGGNNYGIPAAGSLPTVGTIKLQGAPGMAGGLGTSGGSLYAMPGAGGLFGYGGGVPTAGANGSPGAANTGAGASGAGQVSNTVNAGGSGAGGGLAIIYISALLASYVATIGAGGAAGAAGASGFAGAQGGSAIIIMFEFK